MTDAGEYQTVDQLLDRLSSRALPADEAETLMALLDGHEAAAMPTVFRRLHDATAEEELHAAVRILARWVDRPVAAALPPALRALLVEPAVGDLNKLAAADLLRDLGQPVDEDALAGFLRDPDAVAERALAVAVRASRRPPALANALDSIAAMPVPHVMSLIDGITQGGHRQAVHLLAALTHHQDEDVGVSAVAAIDVLDLGEAREMLAVAADHHPAQAVRQQAALTLERVAGARVVRPEQPDAGSSRSARVHVYVSEHDPVIGCFAVLTKAGEYDGGVGGGIGGGVGSDDRGDGETVFDVLTVHYHEIDGVRQYAAAEMASARDIEDLLEELATGRVVAEPASPDAARAALRNASGRSLAGGSSALGYLAWPTFLD